MSDENVKCAFGQQCWGQLHFCYQWNIKNDYTLQGWAVCCSMFELGCHPLSINAWDYQKWFKPKVRYYNFNLPGDYYWIFINVFFPPISRFSASHIFMTYVEIDTVINVEMFVCCSYKQYKCTAVAFICFSLNMVKCMEYIHRWYQLNASVA